MEVWLNLSTPAQIHWFLPPGQSSWGISGCVRKASSAWILKWTRGPGKSQLHLVPLSRVWCRMWVLTAFCLGVFKVVEPDCPAFAPACPHHRHTFCVLPENHGDPEGERFGSGTGRHGIGVCVVFWLILWTHCISTVWAYTDMHRSLHADSRHTDLSLSILPSPSPVQGRWTLCCSSTGRTFTSWFQAKPWCCS